MKSIDVVGLAYGYKKIISTGFDAARLESFKAVFKKYGFLFEILDSAHDYRSRNFTCIISEKSAHIRAAVAAYRANRFDLVGALLGYPPCCVKHYYAVVRRRSVADEFVRRCCGNSGKYYWPINNILDFDGRLCGSKAAGLDFSGVPHSSLIAHNPCSYDCKASLKIARLNFLNLRKNILNQGTGNGYSILAKPVLYADDYNFAILDGRSGPGGAVYGGTACVLGFEGIRGKIGAGDSVTVRGQTLTISLRGKSILRRSFPKAPLILPFDRYAVPGF